MKVENMKWNLINGQNSGKNLHIGLRIVIIIFSITFLSTLPSGYLPSLIDLYRAGLAAAIAALVLLERKGK
jgi:hypothetical protein